MRSLVTLRDVSGYDGGGKIEVDCGAREELEKVEAAPSEI